MDIRDFWIGILGTLLCVSLVLGTLFGMFTIGRLLERKSLTKALKASITATYNDGYDDGKAFGYRNGWHDALKTCDIDEMYSGRY